MRKSFKKLETVLIKRTSRLLAMILVLLLLNITPIVAYADADAGMSKYIHIYCEAPVVIKTTIYDANGTVVAGTGSDATAGFDRRSFIYDSFAYEEGTTRASIYMPNSGYKIVFSYGNSAGIPVDCALDVSTLVPSGEMDKSVRRVVKSSAAGGVVLQIDGTTEPITNDNIEQLVGGKVTQHYTNWSLPDKIVMNIGESQKVKIVGKDAEAIANLLNWSSGDDKIVKITQDGVINAQDYGTVFIAATDGNKAETCKVIVTKEAESVVLRDIVMVIGERTLIRPIFIPDSTTERKLNYDFADNGIIEIDQNGVIKALASGVVEVTGQTPYGIADSFTVIVQTNYTDYAVTSGWYDEKSFEYAVQRGLFDAYLKNGKIAADHTVKRADFIVALLKSLNIEPLATFTVVPFSDVSGADAGYINTAKQLGIVAGTDSAGLLFEPDRIASRAEQFQIIYNLINSKLIDGTKLATASNKKIAEFADADDVANWLQPALAYLLDKGIVVGDGSRLMLNEPLTLGQLAALLMRLAQ